MSRFFSSLEVVKLWKRAQFCMSHIHVAKLRVIIHLQQIFKINSKNNSWTIAAQQQRSVTCSNIRQGQVTSTCCCLHFFVRIEIPQFFLLLFVHFFSEWQQTLLDSYIRDISRWIQKFSPEVEVAIDYNGIAATRNLFIQKKLWYLTLLLAGPNIFLGTIKT